MATSFEYSAQAATYDSTRAASPSVLGPIAEALGRPDCDGLLLDVGGGTGNYAAALTRLDWRPIVVDRNQAMLTVAERKALPVVRGDAASLPVPSGSVDAVMFVSMLHHVPDWKVALSEAQRVVRVGGRVVVMGFAREHLYVHGVEDYFPVTLDHFASGHQTLAELRAELPGAREFQVLYEDQVDGSLAALAREPARMLDADVRRQTSFVEWAAANQPDELTSGLAQLELDLSNGLRPQDRHLDQRRAIGDALVFAWTAPGP